LRENCIACGLDDENWLSPEIKNGRETQMLRIESIVGSRSQPEFSEELHRLEHSSAVDFVEIAVADLSRRRLLTHTRKGEQLAIALPRDEKLYDGAILLLDDARAIVVRATTESWLKLKPATISDAIELGYHAGNLHWRVSFDGEFLMVALEGPPEDYLARLEPMLASKRIEATVLDAEHPKPLSGHDHRHRDHDHLHHGHHPGDRDKDGHHHARQ
jgi:urease accessory protein